MICVNPECVNYRKETDEGPHCMYCGHLLAEDETGSESGKGDQQEKKNGDQLKESESKFDSEGTQKPGGNGSSSEVTEPKPDGSGKRTERLKKLGIVLLGAFVVVTIIAVVWTVIMPKERLYYVVQEHGPKEQIDSVMSINSAGKNNRELASERGGLTPPMITRGIENNIFAPDGKHFVLFSIDENIYIPHIYSINGDDQALDNDESNIPGLDGGFSPDSRYFAYTTFNKGSEPTTHVLTLDGDEVTSVDDAVFGAFMPNSKGVIVIEVDPDSRLPIAVSLVDIEKGEYTNLTEIEADKDSTWWGYQLINLFCSIGGNNQCPYSIPYSASLRPFAAPDGKSVYYVQGNDLMSVPAKGGSPTSVYEFGEAGSFAFTAPDKKNLVIMDYDSEGKSWDLVILNPKNGDDLRIDKYVVLSPDNYDASLFRYGGSSLKFSPNNKTLAYMVSKDRRVDLYVSDLKRQNRKKLASGAGWFTFDFSSDNRIVYIERGNPNAAGDLFVSELDGSNKLRLDRGVWSFKVLNDGRTVVYFKVTDLEQGKPESEMYSIRIDGKKQKQIMNADYGLFTFIQ